MTPGAPSTGFAVPARDRSAHVSIAARAAGVSRSSASAARTAARVLSASGPPLPETAAQERLEHWRAAVSGNGGPDADSTLAAVRAALADDLDTPAALAAIDAWADLSLAGTANPVEGAPGVIGRTLDALLGIRL